MRDFSLFQEASNENLRSVRVMARKIPQNSNVTGGINCTAHTVVDLNATEAGSGVVI